MQMAAFRTSAGTSAPPPSKHTVSIDWDPSPSTGVAYYNVYRGTASGGPYNLLGRNITATSYTDSTVQLGATYFYVTTAVDANRVESVYSNEFPAVIPSL
jgi:fibronectin type 3 domain-containing protein